MQIAIDGPAGVGKSTLAKALAEHLGIIYLDTGRCIARWHASGSRAGVRCRGGAGAGESVVGLCAVVSHGGREEMPL